MKTIQLYYFNKSILSITSIAFLFFISFSFSACARKLTFAVSPVVPAAKGKVKIEKSKNDNYIIEVKIEHLAPPDRLSPPAKVYVVWMQSESRDPENIGMIKTSTGFLSSALKGEMTTTSVIKPTGIFITAEDNGTVRYPGSQVVLQTK